MRAGPGGELSRAPVRSRSAGRHTKDIPARTVAVPHCARVPSRRQKVRVCFTASLGHARHSCKQLWGLGGNTGLKRSVPVFSLPIKLWTRVPKVPRTSSLSLSICRHVQATPV